MDNCNGLGRLEAGAARRGSLNHQRTRWIPPILRWLLLLQLAISGVAKAARFELVSVPAATPTTSNDTPASARCQTQLNESFGRLPLMFESADGGGAFLCRGSGYCLSLSPAEVALTIEETRHAAGGWRTDPANWRGDPARSTGGERPPARVRITLVGANVAAPALGLERLPTEVNYFLGNDPGKWRTGVAVFGKVRYQGVYPGIDVFYYGNQRQLEYDFVVAPGGSVSQIRLRFDAAEKLEIDRSGDLILQTAAGRVRQRSPVVYQELDGRREAISGRFVLRGEGGREVGFEVGAYDRSRPLIIDPVLVYSTFLGGSGFERAWDIAVDAAGNAYLVGETSSTNLPNAGPPYPTYNGGLCDVFVAKVAASGTNLVYATYLGGDNEDAGFGIALDTSANVYVTGLTASTNFPVTTNAISRFLHGTPYFGHYPYDAFVAKLDTSGSHLLYATYLGGAGADVASAITVNGNGDIYVTGETSSPDFSTNALSRPFGGVRDAFVVKLTTSDSNAVYSTYLGGRGDDLGQSIALDSLGNAIVVGLTTSADFPITNALQTNHGGGSYDMFVTKLAADGTNLIFSTYLGGNGDDEAFRVALDASNNVYLTGTTTSTSFPATTNSPSASVLYSTNSGLVDAFVFKLDASGTNVVYWTFLGGAHNDEGWSIAVDTNGSAYVVGLTASADFPAVNAYQPALAGAGDAFVAKLNPSGTALDFSTYLGGSLSDNGYGIALDNAGNAYITGVTPSADFPVYPTTNGLQSAFGGGPGDVFVAKLFSRNAVLQARRPDVMGSGGVSILWPRGLPDFELESTDNLQGTNTVWLTVTNPTSIVGDDYALTYSDPIGNLFFRLRRIR